MLLVACGGSAEETVEEPAVGEESESLESPATTVAPVLDKITFGFIPSAEQTDLQDNIQPLMKVLSDGLGIEVEGFVTILPRRGVCVNVLELCDVKNAYNAIGMVEASIVIECFEKIEPSHILILEELNEIQIQDVEKNDYSRLFKTNIQFHNVYLDISGNELIKKFILPTKQRLYDFPRQNYIKEWETRNCKEHALFISWLKKGNPEKAAKVLKDIHWSFEYQKNFIKKFYNISE